MKANQLHPPTTRPVRQEETPQALALVFGYLEPQQRDEQIETLLSSPLFDGTKLTGLLGAYRENQLVGAMFAQLLPGKTAQAWLPRVRLGEPPETAAMLLRAIDAWLKEQQVELAQMLFEQISESEERLLIQGEYNYLTDLLYLASLPESFPSIQPPSELHFKCYDPSDRESLKILIDSTYQHSQDCPQLNDSRDMEAVLEGYQASGVFRPELWSIAQHQEKNAGCLLLADHPEYDNVELVYMGVVPEMRGRGWGMKIARFAQWQAHLLGRARLVVAVDAANQPAVSMYSAVGFQAWDRRRVYCWRGDAEAGRRISDR